MHTWGDEHCPFLYFDSLFRAAGCTCLLADGRFVIETKTSMAPWRRWSQFSKRSSAQNDVFVWTWLDRVRDVISLSLSGLKTSLLSSIESKHRFTLIRLACWRGNDPFDPFPGVFQIFRGKLASFNESQLKFLLQSFLQRLTSTTVIQYVIKLDLDSFILYLAQCLAHFIPVQSVNILHVWWVYLIKRDSDEPRVYRHGSYFDWCSLRYLRWEAYVNERKVKLKFTLISSLIKTPYTKLCSP